MFKAPGQAAESTRFKGLTKGCSIELDVLKSASLFLLGRQKPRRYIFTYQVHNKLPVPCKRSSSSFVGLFGEKNSITSSIFC